MLDTRAADAGRNRALGCGAVAQRAGRAAMLTAFSSAASDSSPVRAMYASRSVRGKRRAPSPLIVRSEECIIDIARVP
jgi:hypothetical protein